MNKQMIRGGLALLAVAAALAACSPQEMETPPVTVKTSQGPVTCQLYTHSQVYWDRSTDRPATMSVKDADNICRQEGYRVQRLGL